MKSKYRSSLKHGIHRTLLASAVLLVMTDVSAWAQEGSSETSKDGYRTTPFELGAVTVYATRPQVGEIGEDQAASVVTRDDMARR